MRSILLPILLASALTPGCAAVAAAALGGVVANQAMDDTTYVSQVELPADRTWALVKSSMSHMSLLPIEVDEDLRQLEAKVDSSRVQVSVAAFDLNRTEVVVSAKQWAGLAPDGVMAEEVRNRLLERLRAE